MTPLLATLTWNAPAPPATPPTPPVGSVLVFDTDLPGMHPLFDRAPIDRRWQDLVFDRLFSRNARGALASAIVARAEISPEAVTVQLRSGILFHDGRPLGADDVCATVAYQKDPSIAGCEELSDESAQIRFASASPEPTDRLGFAVLPAGLTADDLRSDGPFALHPVGTGPMTAVRGRREVKLDGAPGSHRPGSFAHLEVSASGDPVADLRTLTTGGVDVVFGLPPAMLADAKAAKCTVTSMERTSGVALAVVARAGIKVPTGRSGDAPFLDATGWVIGPPPLPFGP